MADVSLHTHGSVLEVRSSALYRVELPNGKVILAHLSKRLAAAAVSYPPGTKLLLEFTPYDFDQARIVAAVD